MSFERARTVNNFNINCIFGIWSKLYSIRNETRWICQITQVIYVTFVVPVVMKSK